MDDKTNYNIEELDSNIFTIDNFQPEYYTQLTLSDSIKLPCNYIKKEYIKQITGMLLISQVKIIDTIEGESLEGQVLTGKKLIIIGNITIQININCNKCRGNNCIINCEIPFSTYIIIPKSISNIREIQFAYYIEDISIFNIINKQAFLGLSIFILLDKKDDDSCKL